MKDHVIGVDIGTTGTKTGIYDREGRLVGEAFEESILHYPRPGEVEQDPEDIFRSVVNTVQAAMRMSGLAPQRIAAIALDGQMAGIMAVDADWQPVTHYDSWLDTRCAPWLEELRPHEEDIIRTCGMALAFNHAPKILYWRDRPEVWAKIHSFLQPAAYAAGKLAGLKGRDAFMDRTYLVFTGFGSGEHSVWNEELLSRFNLTTEKLPRIVEPWEIIGTVQDRWAEALGVAAGTPIAAGCGDQSANVLGGGLVDPGVVFDTSGTAAVFATVIDSFGTDTTYRCLMTCPHVVPGLYFPMAYVAGGGLNLRWFRDALSPLEKAAWEAEGANPYDALAAAAAEIPPGAEKLLFLPHLSGRNTPNDPNMRGAFLGLTWRHGKAHMVRAIMESIAYEYAFYLRAVRQIAPGYDPKFAINIGGGAKSALLRQIKADALGLDYHTQDRAEFGTLGAAIVAGHAVGLFPDLRETARRFAGVSQPATATRPAATAAYAPYVDSYIDAMETLSPLFTRLGRRLADHTCD
ncbi:xylulose kinase [Cereibacter changlensis JA139]|uniref:Xylulose kinase n=2 Tax=Cereibacter changlensis TaxID=402884 RepID=A0A2T4JSU3_9RHOB|nr:FGGY family carbohydrate kinase [Cereibacter changlensis]PTE20992.1 xylulose kinase [Cereibacter changlensis JA139]PZX56172.1 xylulokinase [Cereibacter changlensis]